MKLRTALLTCFLLFLCNTSFSQIKANDLYGSWVATKITYLTGEQLPDDNILKYTYLKYTFAAPESMYISNVYYDLGTLMLFNLKQNLIEIRINGGSVVNTVKVLTLEKDKLVIVQDSGMGLEDHTAISYTFFREKAVQNAMRLNPDDIYSVNGSDTTYKSGQKIYAKFNGPSFHDYISDELHKKGITVRSGLLLASFIVNNKGLADSLKILNSINPKYDKAFTQVFSSVRTKWKPAELNNTPVGVMMYEKMQYFTSDEVLPSYFNSKAANAAYNEKNFELALYYYDIALESKPDEVENLYHRGICKQNLGNMIGACADWKKVRELGSKIADELLAKNCR